MPEVYHWQLRHRIWTVYYRRHVRRPLYRPDRSSGRRAGTN